MSESIAADSDGVVTIDTAALARPRYGAARRTGAVLKQAATALAAFFLALAWFVLVVMVTVWASEDMTGAGEAVVAIIGLVIGAVPLLLGVAWLIRFRHRHFSGVGTMIAATDFDAAELARPVPSLDVPLGSVIAAVEDLARRLGPAPPTYVETDPAKLRQARNLRLGLLGAFVGGFILYAATGSVPTLLPVAVAVVGYPMTLMRARQVVQPTLEALRKLDPRKPVLLLRSFQDDQIQLVHRFRTRLGDVEQVRRFEQQIAGMLDDFGPLIAVGKPGDELPPIGAARDYLSDEAWQPAVIRWIDEAVFVAMIAGATEWIRWELGRILEMGRVRHLLVLLPPVPATGSWAAPDSGTPAERWANVLAALAGTRWHSRLAGLDLKGLLLVLLQPAGHVVAIRRTGKAPPYADDYQLAIAIALYDIFCRSRAA